MFFRNKAKQGIFNVLTKLEVFEISVVTVPANQNAVVTEVKAKETETKSGRRNRKADEEIIRNCIESLKSLLDEGDGDKEDNSEKSAEPTVQVNDNSEEPKAAENAKKAEELLAKINELKGGSDNVN